MNTVGQPVEITFTDDAAWRAAINAANVNGTTVSTATYSVTAGKITLDAALFVEAKNYTVAIQAGGYVETSVQQTIAANVPVIPAPVTNPVTNPTLNLALNKPTAASADPHQPSDRAVDGKLDCRWESAFSDPQWISVDLGAVTTINRVLLNWENAYCKAYTIEVSTDGTSWTTVYSTTTGNGGIDDLSFSPASARYVKMNGTKRGTPYGYSLWEFEVYGGNTNPLASPALAKDTTLNTLGQPIEIAFVDDAAWRSKINKVEVDGTALNSTQYSIEAGKITLDATLFTEARL
jgi:hypothetical protein